MAQGEKAWRDRGRRARAAAVVALAVLCACQTPNVAVEGSAAPDALADVSPGHRPPAPAPVVAVQMVDSSNRFPVDFGPNRPAQWVDGQMVRPFASLPGTDRRPRGRVWQRPAFDKAPSGALVLYDTTSKYGWLGELYAMAAQALVSHFCKVTCAPVATYKSGDLFNYQAAVYLGSSYDEPVPLALLDDILADQTPVVWIYDNIWQLVNRAKDFSAAYGYKLNWFDLSTIATVQYRGTPLTRDPSNASGLIEVKAADPKLVTTLATAVRADGSTLPWAVRSKNLTFVSENPFAYISFDDRMLAFADMLFDILAPKTAVRHRALLRLEDVNASQNAKELREITDFLASEHVPFSLALIPLYVDALGAFNNGNPLTLHWLDRPAMLSAVKYATLKGGRLILHGYTHQFGTLKNPYSGVTADDFEFIQTHVDAKNSVIYDGAVPGDSAAFALGRVASGLAELAAAGLQKPITFEYPHYAGSSVDSKAIATVFGKAYHRGLFYGGDLGYTAADPAHSIGMFYPYAVTDVYGWKVIPENLGNYEPKAYNNHPPRLAADIVKTAKNNLVVRDGVASLFFHPYYPLAELKKIVAGVKALGYTFVAGDDF